MKDKFDREITYMRLSVTDRCNLRCRYCMPENGVQLKSHNEILSENEMVTACQIAAELGITKIRITGGEPLVKKNILNLCSRISDIEGIKDLAVTTNGILLSKMALELKIAGVRRLNISLDTLDPDKYRSISRIGTLSDALNGIYTAFDTGFDKIKINTVLIGGFNDDEIEDLAHLTMEYPIDVRFIELMPMPGSAFDASSYISSDIVRERLHDYDILPADGVAKMLQLKGAKGRIGLISPVSCPFCSECNRIRLTADGKLKPCLHSQDEFSIKGLGRDEAMCVFKQAINAKPKEHADLSGNSLSRAGRNMNAIGG